MKQQRKYEDLDSDETKKMLGNIQDVFKTYSFCLEEILDFCHAQEIIYDNTAKRLVMSLIFSKAIKTYYAIYSLCKEGYGGEAIVLFRTLMDMNFNLRFIYCSDEEYSNRFLDYHDYAVYECNLPKKGRSYLKDVEMETILISSPDLKEGHDAYNIKYPKGRRDTWSGKSIHDMLQSLPDDIKGKELRDYDTFYKVTSFHVHSNIVSIKDRITADGIFRIAPNLQYLDQVFPISTHYIVKIIALWLKYMDINLPENMGRNLYNIQCYTYSKFETGSLTKFSDLNSMED